MTNILILPVKLIQNLFIIGLFFKDYFLNLVFGLNYFKFTKALSGFSINIIKLIQLVLRLCYYFIFLKNYCIPLYPKN